MSVVAINKINTGINISVSPIYRKMIKKVFNSLFDWTDLPEEVQSRHIEGFLFDTGQISFYKVLNKYYVLPVVLNDWDMYGDLRVGQVYSPFKGNDPSMYEPNSTNSYGLVSNNNTPQTYEGEFIYNNIDKEPTLINSEPYLNMLDIAFNSLKIDILNARNMRLIFSKSDNKSNKLKTTLSKIYTSDNPFYIIREGHATELRSENFTSKSFSPEIINTINTTEEKLHKSVGLIFDTKGDKRERLITSEIETSNFEASHILKSMLELRERAVKKINKLFNLTISVSLSSNAEQIVESLQVKQQQKLGAQNNENNIQ